jgi:hypothetical protein
MDPLVVTVSHSLAKDEVIRRLKPALGRAVQMFPVLSLEQEHWSDDRMDFRVKAFGQFATGNVLVGDKDVRTWPGFATLFAFLRRSVDSERPTSSLSLSRPLASRRT